MGNGRYAVSEQNVNRPAPPPIPVRSATAGAEEHDIPQGDADDEEEQEGDDNLYDAVGDAIGPLPDDQPVLIAEPQAKVYCASCHQGVWALRFNLCPACKCTDSTIPLHNALVQQCRNSPVVNGQKILGVTLKQAIARNTRDRILDRMKLEPHEEFLRPPC